MDAIERLHVEDQAIIDSFREYHGVIPTGRPLHGKQLLLVTMTGVKPGRRRTIPLLYAIDGPTRIVAASAGARPDDPAWARHLRGNPNVLIELPKTRLSAVARELEGIDRDRGFAIASSQMKNLAAHQDHVARRIPLFRLIASAQSGLGSMSS